ncbi:MmgE/PrpD family protein [Nocardioidaceae bacterium]|nr:MmgE/PrpD family protein [Nocardioidaceae bacterium]
MTHTPSVSRDLVERAVRVHRDLPAEVSEAARLHLLDALGVGIAGSIHSPLGSLPAIAAGHPGGRSSVLGSGLTTTAPVAALVNGALIHSLEFDDTHVASIVHGSSTVAAAALAVAQETEADGEAMLSAFALGWEVLVRMGLASPGALQARGFQTTSAVGPFAAALVSGLLHGDPVDTIVDALGIAGSQVGGTFAFLADGDTVKAGQPAWAAHAGLWAAELARSGMTGPERVLEGPLGFYELYAGDEVAATRLREELDDLGDRWHLLSAAYKLIPCCHFIHPFVEAVGEVLDTVDAHDVASIHCHVPRGAMAIIADPWESRQHPATPHDVRWSLPYVLAARVVDGEVGLDLFTREIGGERLELSRRITAEPWEDSGFPGVYPARVTVTTRDGRRVEASVPDVLGGASRPLTREQVVAKARTNLAAGGLPTGVIEDLVAEVLDAGGPTPTALGDLLGPRGG